MDKKLNFVFFGGEPLSVPTLEKLYENGFLPALIVCNPDKSKGRNLKITPPATKVWAKKNNIPYIQNMTELKGTFDLFIIVSYGKMIPKNILDMPKYGAINIHPSLLPRYRGPSPIVTTILNGDTETGVTIIKIDEEMDHGPILAQEKIILNGYEMAQDLEKTLANLGGELLVKIMPEFVAGKIKLEKQDESKVAYCKKIKKEDGLVNLEALPPSALYNKFRAYAHWPRIFFFKDGKRIIITDATLENGKFVIKKVIPEGKKEITWQEFKKQK